MSNMLAIDKKKVSLLLPIRVVVRMDKAAKMLNVSRNEVASAMLDSGTTHIELTHEDIEAIRSEMEANREKRKRN